MRPRKVAQKVRGESWGKALYMAPNVPGGRTSPSSGTNTSWSSMSRLTVPRIPIGSHSPGNDAPGEGHEELPAVDHVAPVHLSRGGAEAPPAHAERGIRLALLDRLAVGLAVEGARLDHLAELGRAELLVTLARGGGHGHGVGEHAHHQHGEAVHVEGERGRGIALRELLRDQAVGLVVRPEPAVAGGNAEAEEAGGSQIRIVVEGEGRLAIMLRRAGSEALAGQIAGEGDQLALAGGRAEIHGPTLCPSSGPRAQAPAISPRPGCGRRWWRRRAGRPGWRGRSAIAGEIRGARG